MNVRGMYENELYKEIVEYYMIMVVLFYKQSIV